MPATDRLTHYGGVAVWSHFVEKLGVVTDLAQPFQVPRSSPNATPLADVLHTFMFKCLMAAGASSTPGVCRTTRPWPRFSA